MSDFFEEYKKYIISTIIVLIIVGISYYFYNYKNLKVKNLGKNEVSIKMDKSKKEIKLTNSFKGDTEKNIYNYQVKVFLKDFDLSCNGEEKICKQILKNKNKLNNFILGSYSGNLKKLDEFKLNLDEFFINKFDKNSFKDNVIDLLYTFQNNFVKQENITKTGYEKYFKFKLKNGEKEIKLNNLEVQCASEIKMSVIPGTFEEDKIITQKVEENCKNLGGEGLLTLENQQENKESKKKKVILNFKIKRLRINYVFYEKKGGKYKEVDSKEVLLDYNQTYILSKDFIKEVKKTKTQDEKIVDFKDKISNSNISSKKKYKNQLNEILRKKYKEKLNKLLIERYKRNKK